MILQSLSDLFPVMPPIPLIVGTWWNVPEWCLGLNDTEMTCARTAVANLHALVTGQVMSDGEIELGHDLATGADPFNPATDKGEYLDAVLAAWQTNGWPGDPGMKPRAVCALRAGDLDAAIYLLGGAVSWFMLPIEPESEEPLFLDTTLDRGLPGVMPHAMFECGVGPSNVTLVTWGRDRSVSRRWRDAYWRGGFGVWHPAWTPPVEAGAATLVSL